MRLAIVFFILIVTFSCEEKENKSGYNCLNGQCIATFDDPTYLTIQDCQTECSSNNQIPTDNGYIYFKVTFDLVCNRSLTWIDLGYSSNPVDLDKNIFIEKWLIGNTSPAWQASKKLASGTYYYKATKRNQVSDAQCLVTKTGSILISAGKRTDITISF